MQRPNLVYVFADQLRFDALGCTGQPDAHTPHLDRFAAQSCSVVNATSVYPMCAPHRASLFTGKYPSSTGMVINELRAMPDPDAFGHVLTAAGYRTGYVGKWHLYGRNHSPQEQFCPPGPYRLGFDGYWASYNFNHKYYEGFYYLDTPQRIEVEGYEPDAQTDLAIEFLQSARDVEEPFALFLSYGTPHDPWEWWNVPEADAALFQDRRYPDPPNYADGSAEYWKPSMTHEWWLREWRPNRERYRRVYHAMVANLDRNVGRLLAALDRHDQTRETIVVFTSDHGEMFGAHGRIAKNTFYDEAAHIPFFIRWPGQIAANSSSDVCLNTPDVMPTLLTLLYLPVPASVEGADLSASLRGRPGEEPAAALLQGMGHTFMWEDGFEWRALRDKRHTYAVDRVDRAEYLFDNLADPFQQRNLINDPGYVDQRDRYRADLRDRMNQLQDGFEPCTWYRDHWTTDGVITRSATRQAPDLIR